MHRVKPLGDWSMEKRRLWSPQVFGLGSRLRRPVPTGRASSQFDAVDSTRPMDLERWTCCRYIYVVSSRQAPSNVDTVIGGHTGTSAESLDMVFQTVNVGLHCIARATPPTSLPPTGFRRIDWA